MNHSSSIQQNPFSVYTPEILSPNEIVELFVPYPEFKKLEVTGHQFLDGHRGSGKSMMLRMMCPDCQTIIHGEMLSEIPYFGVYIPIKSTTINNPEYLRLEDELGGSVLSESLLAIVFLSHFFQSINNSAIDFIEKNNLTDTLKKIVNNPIKNIFSYAGISNNSFNEDCNSPKDILNHLIKTIDGVFAETTRYVKLRALTTQITPFSGAILGFQDTLLPIVSEFIDSGIIPNIPVYFLLDDADNLSLLQTKVLNTWVSYRSTNKVSLKISTQLNYKTYETISSIRIQSPHDFSRIEFTTNRTGSQKDDYFGFLKQIVERRLRKYGINKSAEEFFVNDVKQDLEIQKIADSINDNYKTIGRGFRANDDIYRYARPEYIRMLNEKKRANDYSYSGFRQLVHISTGIVRFFLEPASSMFAEQQKTTNLVESISPTIQDRIIREEATKLLTSFENLNNEEPENNYRLSRTEQLSNLIHGLGEIFKMHILDESESQRRLDSFTISGQITPELKEVLKLGVTHGYFYTDLRGARDGLGRETRYVLTRRLAPMFHLDPNGYSGDKSLPSEVLIALLTNRKAFTNKLKRNGTSILIQSDLPLFKENE